MAGRPTSRKKEKGEKDASVWKRDEHWEREKDTGPGTGWVKDANIPRAQKEPYRNRPVAAKEERKMWDAYKRSTGRKGKF